jgi:hypothetical protein
VCASVPRRSTSATASATRSARCGTGRRSTATAPPGPAARPAGGQLPAGQGAQPGQQEQRQPRVAARVGAQARQRRRHQREGADQVRAVRRQPRADRPAERVAEQVDRPAPGALQVPDDGTGVRPDRVAAVPGGAERPKPGRSSTSASTAPASTPTRSVQFADDPPRPCTMTAGSPPSRGPRRTNSRSTCSPATARAGRRGAAAGGATCAPAASRQPPGLTQDQCRAVGHHRGGGGPTAVRPSGPTRTPDCSGSPTTRTCGGTVAGDRAQPRLATARTAPVRQHQQVRHQPSPARPRATDRTRTVRQHGPVAQHHRAGARAHDDGAVRQPLATSSPTPVLRSASSSRDGEPPGRTSSRAVRRHRQRTVRVLAGVGRHDDVPRPEPGEVAQRRSPRRCGTRDPAHPPAR